MNNEIIYIAAVFAIIDWIAVGANWKKIEYVAKPGVVIILLIWLSSTFGFENHLKWFALGLVFSLMGDIFLMLPNERFIAGLISFLLAHVAYLIGFTQSVPPINMASITITIFVALVTAQIYRRIADGLIASGNHKLKIPVLAYSAIIGLMLLSALITMVRHDWSAGTALLVSTGALLFFISDTILALNKFVSPIRFGNLIVIITYHIAQGLIAFGAVLHIP